MTVIEGSWPEQREDGGRKGKKIKKNEKKKKAGMGGVRDEKREGGREGGDHSSETQGCGMAYYRSNV